MQGVVMGTSQALARLSGRGDLTKGWGERQLSWDIKVKMKAKSCWDSPGGQGENAVRHTIVSF